MSGLEWWHLLLSGSEGPDFRAGGQMFGGSGEVGCPGCLGRMSGAWEMLLAPSVGSPHPWTWGLVHLHAHLREDPLGT